MTKIRLDGAAHALLKPFGMQTRTVSPNSSPSNIPSTPAVYEAAIRKIPSTPAVYEAAIRALRAGDVEKARRLVADDPSETERMWKAAEAAEALVAEYRNQLSEAITTRTYALACLAERIGSGPHTRKGVSVLIATRGTTKFLRRIKTALG